MTQTVEYIHADADENSNANGFDSYSESCYFPSFDLFNGRVLSDGIFIPPITAGLSLHIMKYAHIYYTYAYQMAYTITLPGRVIYLYKNEETGENEMKSIEHKDLSYCQASPLWIHPKNCNYASCVRVCRGSAFLIGATQSPIVSVESSITLVFKGISWNKQMKERTKHTRIHTQKSQIRAKFRTRAKFERYA